MKLARSVRSLILVLLSTFVLVTVVSGESPQQPSTPAVRITAATNVTLRALPSTNAAAVAQLPLGTELTDSGPADLDRTWVRVKLADGREGWLRTDLTKPIDRAWRWPTFDRIIEERLGRKGDGFAAQAELVAFVDRVAPEYTDAEGHARIDLARLRALQAALGTIPFRGDQREPYASFLGARKATVTYDDPAGRWLVASEAIWDLQSKHASTATADDLAWFAVTNGLAGECEGYLPCYLRWRNRLQGEYLRREPNGRHVDEAIGLVKETADAVGASPKPNSAVRIRSRPRLQRSHGLDRRARRRHQGHEVSQQGRGEREPRGAAESVRG